MTFAAQSPDLRRRHLIAMVSRLHARSPWLTAPLIRFLFINSQLRYPLLSAWASRPRPFDLRFAVHLESLRPGPPEDLHLLVMLMLGTRARIFAFTKIWKGRVPRIRRSYSQRFQR